MLSNFTFITSLSRRGSYAFLNWCRSWILRNKKKDTVNQPPIGYRVPASRHWFVQTQRNGGSENQSRRFKWACQIVCSTTAFFFCRRAADHFNIRLKYRYSVLSSTNTTSGRLLNRNGIILFPRPRLTTIFVFPSV